jgi:hypothetical protein
MASCALVVVESYSGDMKQRSWNGSRGSGYTRDEIDLASSTTRKQGIR